MQLLTLLPLAVTTEAPVFSQQLSPPWLSNVESPIPGGYLLPTGHPADSPHLQTVAIPNTHNSVGQATVVDHGVS